jgi:hypothetical protein
MPEEKIIVPIQTAGEGWSWPKFFSGLFNGVNTAKAIVTTFHQIIIALIVGSLIFCGILLWKHFSKPKKAPPAPICVTTNNGQVHSSSDDNKKKFGLINLF